MTAKIFLILKGFAMGIAEVIPGVSGGTIAFITGIYQRLLQAISAFKPSLISTFKKDGLKGLAEAIDVWFLVLLFGGMAAGLVFGLVVITYLLENHPILVWSFFFALILASIPLVLKQITQIKPLYIFYFLASAVVAYYITIAAPVSGSENLLWVFICGIIAVSALMLPGLSGSFLLLLLGMYTVVIPTAKSAISNPISSDGLLVICFGLGMIIGALIFARTLTYTFKHFPNPTLALLGGLLLGSLNKVWPWQNVITTRINSKGLEVVERSESVRPSTFADLTNNFLYGNDPKLWAALMTMALTIIFVLGLNVLGEKFSSKEK
jgi:putative membrane protein